MLEDGFTRSLSGNPIDEVTESVVDAGFYRTWTVKSPTAVELEHVGSPRRRRPATCYAARGNFRMDAGIAEGVQSERRSRGIFYRQFKRFSPLDVIQHYRKIDSVIFCLLQPYLYHLRNYLSLTRLDLEVYCRSARLGTPWPRSKPSAPKSPTEQRLDQTVPGSGTAYPTTADRNPQYGCPTERQLSGWPTICSNDRHLGAKRKA